MIIIGDIDKGQTKVLEDGSANLPSWELGFIWKLDKWSLSMAGLTKLP